MEGTFVPMHVLFLSLTNPASGNCTTAKRICNYLRQAGMRVTLVGLTESNPPFHSPESFLAYIHQEEFDLVIGLHALHSGKWLRFVDDVPYVIIFGGTDVNEYSINHRDMQIMTAAVEKAQHLVVFSSQMESRLHTLWSSISPIHLSIIPQAPVTYPIHQGLPAKLKVKVPGYPTVRMCTLVTALRPVKDPLYLCRAFSDWHCSSRPDVFLLIAGPVLDQGFAETFLSEIGSLAGVVYMGELSMGELHALMKESLAVLNTSLSEGMCTAILEAMKLEVPVVARNIPANAAILQHEKTGLLFNTPEHCLDLLSSLLDTPSERQTLITSASHYLSTTHSLEHEKQSYVQLVRQVLRPHTDSPLPDTVQLVRQVLRPHTDSPLPDTGSLSKTRRGSSSDRDSKMSLRTRRCSTSDFNYCMSIDSFSLDGVSVSST